MSDLMKAAEGFSERLLVSQDSLDPHFLNRARRLAAAVYLAVDGREEDAKRLMRKDAETLMARLRNSQTPLAITEGARWLSCLSKNAHPSLPCLQPGRSEM
jgi:hypothetical protein